MARRGEDREREGSERGRLDGGPACRMGPRWQWGGGYDRWARARKRKENGFNSNLKLIFQIYSNLIRFK
jgi:hypothetical protein